MRKISNPLTIIGMFAGIAEVSGTVVLPFVSQELQHIFIWYVMGFPAALVIIFFITLNFNTKALYAPGDFNDEENFMKLVRKTIDSKLEEVKTNNPDLANELENVQVEINTVLDNVDRRFIQAVAEVVKTYNGATLSEIANELDVSEDIVRETTKYLISQKVLYAKLVSAEGKKYIKYAIKK